MSSPYSSRRLFFFGWLGSTALVGALLVSGCARYHAAPLPTAPDLTAAPGSPSRTALTVPASEFLIPGLGSGLAPHAFPNDGLDETSVVTLAVFNDPDLKAARLEEGLASAQLLQAGLLPDPQVSAGGATSAVNYGYSIGIAEDIQALITRGSAKAVASAHKDQVHLDILWQEWQVAEKARELFIHARANDQLQQVLTRSRDLLARQYRKDETAMQKGDATANTVSADLVVLTGAETSLRQLEIDANLTRHQLNQLLGLEPDVHLPLIAPAASAGPDENQFISHDQFEAALAAVARRRVDLLALQAGYKSQEQTVRRAILAQFPAMSAGVEQGRDPVEGINYFGPNVSLTLPLFNRNRGLIAEQRATRAVLHQTYQARLDQAVGDADQVWRAIEIQRRQLHEVNARLPFLEQTAAATEQSFRQGNVEAGLYVNVESSLMAKQEEAIRLRAALESSQSALRTLLGLPFGGP